MATVKERLAESLRVLKNYQDTHQSLVVQGQSQLGTTHTRRLLNNGYLTSVLKGWYIPSLPGSEGDTTVWYASYWQFVVGYANNRFGTQWSLTPEGSLSFYAGETVAPSQLILRAKEGTNNVTPLLHNDSLLVINASLPKTTVVEPRYGVRLYSLAEALVFCSPQYFKRDALNARTCLCSLTSADDILRIVAEQGNSSRAARIIGALRSVGRTAIADAIEQVMKRLGYDVRPENPFEEQAEIDLPASSSPVAMRITLMWQKLRTQLFTLNIPQPQLRRNAEEILNSMEVNYAKDSYHSLSIEGYRVTEALIEQVRSGKWNPQKNSADDERKNALAARGYFQAFNAVKKSVEEILLGAAAGDVVQCDHDKWHFELFEPCVAAGIIEVADLIGYRQHQVYIRGSKHTPFCPEDVRAAMPAFIECLASESNAFVRAVLGHFFLTYIHPYADGNGRTARFIMNVMLVTGGHQWTIVPVERRIEYMSALKAASTQGNILPFAEFILSC